MRLSAVADRENESVNIFATQWHRLDNPGKVPLENQLQDLENDYQNIRASNAAVPPGFHAHLGYLYFQSGKIPQALQSFETEKSLFPESTVFMDRLIVRVKH